MRANLPDLTRMEDMMTDLITGIDMSWRLWDRDGRSMPRKIKLDLFCRSQDVQLVYTPDNDSRDQVITEHYVRPSDTSNPDIAAYIFCRLRQLFLAMLANTPYRLLFATHGKNPLSIEILVDHKE